MKQEVWKDIDGYENKYQVSNLGRVRRLSYYSKSNSLLKPMLMKPINTKGGYKVIGFQHKQYKLHRLIANAFIPNIHNKPFINHIDGNPSNNKIENLEWVTASENTKHAFDIGLCKAYGEYNGKSKLTKIDVQQIRCIYKNRKELSFETGIKVTVTYISNLFNISTSHTSEIIRNKYWNFI